MSVISNLEPKSDIAAASCPNCSNQLTEIFPCAVWRLGEHGRNFGYAKCSLCGLVLANPLPTDDEVSSYYAGSFNYGIYSLRKPFKRLQGSRRWRGLRQRLGYGKGIGKRLLDVGCGHGWFLAAARRSGWDCTGLDFPSEATAFARQTLGLKIIEADFLAADLIPASYDLISLWHALEHMRDPQAVLRRAESLLKPDGMLIVAVPNAKSRGLACVGAGWIWLQQPFVHLWHFSDGNLRDYLKRAGFGEVECFTHDTWDANYLYDALLFPRLKEPFMDRGARLCGRVLGMFGFERSKVEQRVFFYLDEGARLAAYAAQSIGGYKRESKLDGSELLAIAIREWITSRPASH